jgi:hypothetical protein
MKGQSKVNYKDWKEETGSMEFVEAYGFYHESL